MALRKRNADGAPGLVGATFNLPVVAIAPVRAGAQRMYGIFDARLTGRLLTAMHSRATAATSARQSARRQKLRLVIVAGRGALVRA